jgi:hypothetical protein
MQTVLHDHLESGLRDYLSFLLSFILRDNDMRENKTVQELRYDQFIRLGHKRVKQFYADGELINDIDLIPRSRQPMLMIDTLIEEADTANKTIKKQVLVTKPELSKVSDDLSAIVDNMHASLEEIDRVDQLIFPLL